MEVLGFLAIICGALVRSVDAFDCPSSGVFADPLDCTGYYRCDSNLLASKSMCNSNFYFDDVLKNCVQGKCTNPTITVATKTSQGSSSDLFTDPTDCRNYHICNFLLDTVKSTCPHFNYFSTTYKDCEIDDCPTISAPVTTTTTTSAPVTTTTTSAPVTTTTKTSAPVTTTTTTSAPITKTTTNPAPVTTTTITSVPETTTTITPSTTVLPICTSVNQTFPYPLDCHKYYRCDVNLILQVQQCGFGKFTLFQHYDRATGNCVVGFC